MMITAERIRQRIEASVLHDENGCWIWTKTRSGSGYGTFAFGKGRNVGAHRASYAAFVGPIPEGMDVCHRCDVRTCVNPEHLFIGTRSANILDAVAKGRVNRTTRSRGSAHHAAKLTEAAVMSIVARLATGEKHGPIAAEYGITTALVGHIKHGRVWKHVTTVSQGRDIA